MTQNPVSALSKLLPEDLLNVMRLQQVSDAALMGSDKVKDAMLLSGDKVAAAMAASADKIANSFDSSFERAGKWMFLGCVCLSASYLAGALLDYVAKTRRN